MIKKILTIDFKYIMYPCIQLFDRYSADPGVGVNEVWNYIKNDLKLDKFINYDSKMLLNIASIIKNTVDNGAKLILIDEQEEIIKLLKQDPDYDNLKYYISNIDYNHDILQVKGDLSKIRNFNKYNSFTWVGYLFEKDKIDTYNWIKSPNSNIYHNELKEYDNFNTLPAYTLDNIPSSNVDFLLDQVSEVYFSLSPKYIPYEYRHLYNLISELCK